MARDLSPSDVHALAGAYALDALTELERAAFGRHVADCESCTVEVAELSETATRLAAPGARLRTVSVDGGQVTLVTSASQDAAVAVLSGLPAPGKDKAYQLWFIKPGEYRSMAVLPAGERTATVRIGPVGDAALFGVSLERTGGSASGKPTDVRGTVDLR